MEGNKEYTETEGGVLESEAVLGAKIHSYGFNCQLEQIHTVKWFRNGLV